MFLDTHPFEMPENNATLERRKWVYKNVNHHLSTLSPSRRRMLMAVYRAMGKDGLGDVFYETVNRLEIADMLERDKLVPWDIKVLRDLIRLGLVKEQRQTLPLRYWRARGAEYRYSIDPDILWCLRHKLRIAKKRKLSQT